jgi:LysR family transcriptional activator of nhaA
MERLNYRQLQQFWAVARAGSLRAAAEQLDLAPQTLSSQIAVLEHSLGTALFQRVGRRLELTEAGRMVRGYADEIFGLGDELLEAVGEARMARVRPLRVGIAEVVPKSLAYELLSPALALQPPPRLHCREDSLPRLLAELALHRLDLVISDRAPQGEYEIKVHSSLLGECGTAILAAPGLAEGLRDGFPRSLHGAPMLMPGAESRVRAGLQRWLDAHKLRPRIVAEFEDSALMKAFGAAGAGFFAVPAVVAEELCARQGMVEIGRIDEIRQRFHALAGPRRGGHPGVQAVLESARSRLFAEA